MEFKHSLESSPKHYRPTTSISDEIDKQCDNLPSKVSSLANDIYRECKSLVATYGDTFLHNLMPLVVTALENLESLHAEKEEMHLKLAILKEDHRHLVNEYEREKSNRKLAESKNLKLEDDMEEERKLLQSRLTELEANLRVSELKLRNSSDQIARAEEKENEWANKYHDLHDRYTCLIRSYVEYVERARSWTNHKADPHSLATDTYVPSAPEFRTSVLSGCESGYSKTSPNIAQFDSANDYQRNISKSQFDLLQAQAFEAERQRIMRSILETTPELQDTDTLRRSLPDPSFDELSQGDLLSEDGIDAQSYDGSTCNQQTNGGDSSSLDMFNGVTREVNNLIKENQDLVQTKNALNVVTNDLIGRIDDLTCENLRLSSERNALVNNSTGMLLRIKDLEEECRRLRHELESIDLRDSMYTGSLHSGESYEDSDDSDTPLSMRKRFSRVEMARILLERNQYKEELFELQDAIRWTGTLRAEQFEVQRKKRGDGRTGQQEPRKRSRLWNLFAKLFTPKSQENKPTTGSLHQSSVDCEATSSTGQVTNNIVRTGSQNDSPNSTSETQSHTSRSVPISASRPARRPPRTSVRRLGAVEWMPLGKQVTLARGSSDVFGLLRHGSPYPYTCYVRPVCEKLTGFKLWCAACVYKSDQPGARTKEDRDHYGIRPQAAVSEQHVGSTEEQTHPRTTPLRQTVDDSPAATDSSNSLPISRSSTMDGVPSEQCKSMVPGEPDPNLSNLVWICSVALGCGVPLKQLGDSTSGNDQSTGMVHSLITVISMDEPQRNLDTFAVTASTVLCMAAVPGCSTDDLRRAEQTAGWWNSVPLNLSEELLFDDSSQQATVQTGPYRSLYSPAHAGAALATPVTTSADDPNVVLRRSAADPGAPHSHSCQTSYRPWGLWDDPGSMHISTSSMPPTCKDQNASNKEAMVSYFIERKRFLMRNLPGYTASEAVRTRRYGSTTALSQSKPDSASELPSSSDSDSFRRESATSAQPTVWLGCHNGDLFVHSSVTNWHGCLHAIRLPDSVTQIQHFNSRVFVSLANGQLVVFRRCFTSEQNSPNSLSALSLNGAVTSSNLREPASSSPIASMTTASVARDSPGPGLNRETGHNNTANSRLGMWDFTEACVISCGNSRTPVRRTVVVPPANTLWTTYRNQFLVIDALTLQLVNCTEVHPRREAQIQSMCWFADGVWIAVRKDPSLRLYHAFTQQLLQTVDLGSTLVKWLPLLKPAPNNKSNCRRRKSASAMTTALLASNEHLWIGTNVGLVITVPFGSSCESSPNPDDTEPDSTHSVYRSTVNVSGMQASRNEHNGPVRFFLTARGSGSNRSRRGDPPCGSASNDPTLPAPGNGKQLQAYSWCAPPLRPVSHESRALVLSGGEGYNLFDAKHTEGVDPPTDTSVEPLTTCSFSRERNHLIVWELDSHEEQRPAADGC